MEQKQKSTAPRKALSIIGWILCIVFGLMLICNVTIIVKGYLNPDAPPSVLGITPMAVLSGSMSGTQEGHIEIGDLIFVGKVEPAELKEGDVIAYMEGSIVVTHRIMEVQTAEDGTLQWITKGDANNARDEKPIPEEDLIGIYKFRIPKVGDLALFMQTPLGMVIFIGVPVLAFVIYDLLQRRRSARQEQKQTEDMQAELERLRALAAEKASPEADTQPEE